MRGHPRGLQRARAEARDRRPRDIEAGEESHNSAEVEALLTARAAAAANEIFNFIARKLRDLFQHLRHDMRAEVVWPPSDQRPFPGAPDRRTPGGDHDGVRHWCSIDFEQLLGHRVQTLHLTLVVEEVVVGDPTVAVWSAECGMQREIHVVANCHRLLMANEWALHHVVALSVEVHALLFRPPVLAHERVVPVPDVGTVRAIVQLLDAEPLRLKEELMLLAHLGRRLAEHDAASQLAVHPTWAVVLDQEAELIARLDDAILQVAV